MKPMSDGKRERNMNETLDCTNCCIADFKQSLCDCHGDFCTKYKSIGDENDFMQAVLADRPHGEWQYIAQGWHAIRRCSNCKWTQTYSDPKYMGYRYNFCPNCGCRMKGADDGI